MTTKLIHRNCLECGRTLPLHRVMAICPECERVIWGDNAE